MDLPGRDVVADHQVDPPFRAHDAGAWGFQNSEGSSPAADYAGSVNAADGAELHAA